MILTKLAYPLNQALLQGKMDEVADPTALLNRVEQTMQALPSLDFSKLKEFEEGTPALDTLRVGTASHKGARPEMQERTCCFDFMHHDKTVNFVGVFDGHINETAAEFLKNILP